MPNLNLGMDADVFDWYLSRFFSGLRGRCRVNVSSQATGTSFHILFDEIFTNQPRYDTVVTELLIASLNKA
jgi:hypothetical protein